MKRIPMTQEGYDKLKYDIYKLETQDLRESLSDLMDARERGNLEDNSEYDVIKESYNKINDRIHKMRQNLNDSIIIDVDLIRPGTVQLLTKVKIQDLKTGKEKLVTIVPENEINLSEGKISFSSPIGSGLIGKKIGDEMEIKVPSGNLKFKILDIK